MSSDRDRREYVRIQAEELVSVVPFSGSTVLVQGLDVSLHGIRFKSVGCELAPNDFVQISFNLASLGASKGKAV